MTAIIAHRGASFLAPENTLAAISQALEIGVDFIEVDVRLTIDNIPVLMHDSRVNRTTNGRGSLVSYTYKTLKKLDAGSWFHSDFKGEPVPSLNEVFRKVLPSAKLLVELKGSTFSQPLFARRILELIDKYQAEDRVIIQSFNPNLLMSIQRENPEVEVNLLVNYFNRKLPFYSDRLPKLGNIFRFKKYQAVNPNSKWIDRKTVEKIHEEGKKVFCWTIDDPNEMAKLIELGVDGIITNKPHILKGILKGFKA
ncbi:MAG: glycerophosphodiester phosphodiesterase [Luteibaculum sp.]